MEDDVVGKAMFDKIGESAVGLLVEGEDDCFTFFKAGFLLVLSGDFPRR